ncbi:hypothetical protein QR680_009588 [Steinernema hermaphroditum]|uniref:SSD domain-containing protein n=1 Tax=Steinernema hermaphroditum TaxID=289476 RepID=A0AA39M9Q7_9BILA|nr:hypothetical protein QR680_009588 [Steinernema hermaphroditum]
MRHPLVSAYSRLIFHYPGTVLTVTTVVFTLLPILFIVSSSNLHLSNNPEKGFDTRDTEYSGPRLAWQQLQGPLQRGNRVVVATKVREKRSWADELVQSFSLVPCYEAPIPAMDFLSQFVVELESYESIYSTTVLQDLCQMHSNLSAAIAAFDQVTPYRNVLHVANFFSCFAPNFRLNCSYLEPADLVAVRRDVEFCLRHRADLVECSTECQGTPRCPACGRVPSNCSSTMMFDLFYRVLPWDLQARPFYLNTFLPMFTLSGYRSQGFDVPVTNFTRLESALVSYLSGTSLKFKGVSMDVKRDLLLESAIADSRLALVAAVLVFGFVGVCTRSPLYCGAVLWQLASSVVCALYVYSFFSSDFPLLNLVVFVLLLAIGSDDAFLMHHAFPSAETPLCAEALAESLVHAATTMFLTSFSTAVPFFVNVLSDVLVFRSFGLFAGVTLVFNYILLVSFLPAFLVFQRRHIRPLQERLCALCAECASRPRYVVNQLLAAVIVSGRYVWLTSLLVVTLATAYVTLSQLSLPRYNPLQLFVDSNPHEWFDNNAERHFRFVAQKVALPLHARLVWGMNPVEGTAHFDPDDLPAATHDGLFRLANLSDLTNLAAELRRMRRLPFVTHSDKFWPERFLEWSAGVPCSPEAPCCNVSSALFFDDYLDHCLRISTTELFTHFNDTPIYHNISFALVGYTASLPTRLRYSHNFANLSASFDLFDDHLRSAHMWYTTEWTLMSTWFDLLRSIVSDCKQSIVISFLVVTVFALLNLRLMALAALLTIFCVVVVSVGAVVFLGWVIGVLEAVILMLVVGLSFDFTLHYGASVPAEGCRAHRIDAAVRRAFLPVAGAAVSSVIAGAVMLLSATHAFFQVGVFLCVSTSVSWLFSTFFFLPLLSLTLWPSPEECKLCRQTVFASPAIAMKHYAQ